ncbi:MAG: DUF3298 domain-containing protein [Bacteroidales bacterium]|nr:DUF3298 domain-containing protein [Bacteroidales bacterium]
MKDITRIIMKLGASALLLFAAVSCNHKNDLRAEIHDYSDSTAHSYLKVHIELPVPAKGVQSAIRGQLVNLLDERLSHITSYEQERFYPPYEGDSDDTGKLLAYYQDRSLEIIGKMSQEDADERAKYSEDDGWDAPAWEYDFSLGKIVETEGYAVFQSQDYIYMGGAHGGVTGAGYLTFDKNDGHLVDPVIDPSQAEAMQPILVKGLTSYYEGFGETISPEELKDHLMIDGDIIPLPSWNPYPDGKGGLVFTYQQYEIASYAEGMPSFTIPVEEVVAFLSEDARRLF